MTIAAKLTEAQVPFLQIDGRIKRLFSIHQKLKRQKIDLEQVYDFIALRVVTNQVKDCYAALGIIHQTWAPVPGRFKDLIAMPRPNGYQSLHTSVISEGDAVRGSDPDEQMHRMAEEGIAAHWKYKEGRVGAQKDERYFTWMRQLLEYQQELRDPQEFIQNLKVELYPEEVYMFTPKGLVKAFPRGATPIDFAYAIHTDVGHQCIGAKVNGRIVPLRTRLKNGDIVEIMTQTGHKPSRDWLSYVVTSHARNKIKHLIQSEEKARAIELGRKVFEKEAPALRRSTRARLRRGRRSRGNSRSIGAQKADDLYRGRWATASSSPRQLLTKLVPAGRAPGEGTRAAGHCGRQARARRRAGHAARSRSAASTT